MSGYLLVGLAVAALGAAVEIPLAMRERRARLARQEKGKRWTVGYGDKCDLCPETCSGACLPHRFKGCTAHLAQHDPEGIHGYSDEATTA